MKMETNLKKSGAYDELEKRKKFNLRVAAAALVVCVVLFHLIFPLHVLLSGKGLAHALAEIGQYFGDFLFVGILDLSYGDFIGYYYGQWVNPDLYNAAAPGGADPPMGAWVGAFFGGALSGRLGLAWFVWIGAVVTTVVVGFSINPYSKTPNIFGDTRWANDADIEKMSKDNKIGFDGKLIVVGKHKDKLLHMKETLSVLLLAPPGTGKSVGFIVPSILAMDEASFCAHDVKPELFDMCSGHRSRLGPTFQLKWSATDEPDGRYLAEDEAKLLNPDLLARDDKGQMVRDDYGRVKTKPIFYPSWNPLSPKCIPGQGTKRDMYIDRLANVLCPDPSSGGDKFWTSKARAALTGMVHFLVAKVEKAMEYDRQYAEKRRGAGDGVAPDNPYWVGIPAAWRGREASFPALVDWFSDAQNATDTSGGQGGGEEGLQKLFEAAVKEIELNGYPHRAKLELTALSKTPGKTLGSIIATLDDALAPFKMESVRQRTSSCDFSFADLRGMPSRAAREREEAKAKENPKYIISYGKADYEPVSIFISVNQEDAKALSSITGIFVDSANSFLVANGPNVLDDQGRKLGPYPFGFLLDEAPQMPKLDTVMNGPAVGRSKKVFYVIVGQDFGQFEQKYSKPEVETLKSTTALKIVLSQNNEATAKAIAEMAGKMPYTKHSYSEKAGGGGGNKDNPFAALENLIPKGKSVSESYEGMEFLKPGFIMSMPPGKHIVMVQNFMNRPILADTPRFYLEKRFQEISYNLVTLTGMSPAPPMSFEMMEAASKRQAAQSEVTNAQARKEELKKSTRHVLIITPADLQSLNRDEKGAIAEKGALYACAEVNITKENPDFVDPPEKDRILVTDEVGKVADFVAEGKYFVFSRDVLAREINKALEEAGCQTLDVEMGGFLSERAEAIGEEPAADIYMLGYQGGPALEKPPALQATPQYAVKWMTEVLNFILGVEESKRLFDSDF